MCPLAIYCCNLISYWTGWETIYKLDIALAIGAIFFIITYYKKRFKQTEIGLKSILWIVPYLIGLSIISYLGSFAGKNFIPFDWDFLVIGIFSMFVLYLAIINRAKINLETYQEYKNESVECA